MGGASITPGVTLGPYRVIAPLGRGGMGEVWRAIDTRLDREVAIKLLPDELAGDARALERFEREARAASALNHPGIATLLDVGLHDDRRFLVLELLEGRTLHERIECGPIPLDELLDLAVEFASALAAAHEKGIIHRDIKPSNLFVTAHGHAKVLDFGLAKRAPAPLAPDPGAATHTAAADLTQAGQAVGTVAYMSPEQARGEEVDARTDLFSFGCVLYEMATGRRPFEGGSAAVVFDAILNRDPVGPRSVSSDIPPALEKLILRALAKNRDLRPASAAEIRDELRALRRKSGSGEIGVAPARSHRPVVAVVLASVAVVAVVAVVLTLAPWNGGAASPAPPSQGAGLDASSPRSAIPEANEYYEKAILFLRPQFDVARARQMLERALEIDPRFASARALLGMTFILTVHLGVSNDIELIYRGEREARAALDQTPDLAIGHTALGAAFLYLNRAELARNEIQTALDIDPTNFAALTWVALIAYRSGDYATAEALSRRRVEEMPLFFGARLALADAVFEQGRADEAVAEIEKVFEQDAGNVSAHCAIVRILLATGDRAAARARLDRVLDVAGSNFRVRLVDALLLAEEGRKDAASRVIDESVVKYAEIAPFATAQLAEAYAVLGEPERALDWLERAMRGGDERISWFRRDPFLETVRATRRFDELVGSVQNRRVPGSP